MTFGGTIGTQAAVQAVRKLDQLARDDIRAAVLSGLTDAAMPTKRPAFWDQRLKRRCIEETAYAFRLGKGFRMAAPMHRVA